MQMCVCTSHTYNRVSPPPQTPVLETLVKKEASSNINKYYFPRTVSAQRQEAFFKALLKYVLQKVKKK